jgi:Ca-activated chloride channel family protein
MSTNVERSAGGRLVTVDGKELPLRGARLQADARGGAAEVVLEQRFANPYDEPLRVSYVFPLPADGAVSGYAFTVGARRIVGEVDRKEQARERFERALAEGRSAGLVDEERSSLFTQELGNVPPRTEVIAELRVAQRLRWLDEGAWEWRFPTAAGARYGSTTEIAVADAPMPARLTLALTIGERCARPESPAHGLAAREAGDGWVVELADEGGVRLDRDVVVRWAARAPAVGIGLDVGRPAGRAHAFALVTLVPPAPTSAEARPRPRDLILLLDTSGSMGGEPLAQVKKVCAALIDTLGVGDRLELIEFSSSARRWNRDAVRADDAQRRRAKQWLAALQAGGGTEMVTGVLEALAPLGGEAQRQVILLTDGYIGFETEVVKAVRERLPAASRLHVVGVGSAVNRSLCGPVARAGRGVEIIVAPGEDPERAAQRLVARTAAPLVTDVEIGGPALVRAAPARLPDLYAGAPALAALELVPAGGALTVRGRTAFGAWERSVTVPACAEGQGRAIAATLFARELVEDLELEVAAGGARAELDAAIEKLGLDFQIATRLTTWIAISEEPTVDPSAPTRRAIVPQELPHGVSAEGLGLRGAAPTAAPAAMPTMIGAALAPPAGMPTVYGALAPPARAGRARASGVVRDLPRAPAPAKALEKAKQTAAPPRRLRARVLVAAAGELILELSADRDLDWSLARVRVRFRDGTEIDAPVDAARSTRPGRVAAGQVVRLALHVGGRPVEAVIDLGDGPLVLEIEA